jgi:hypothetical protein
MDKLETPTIPDEFMQQRMGDLNNRTDGAFYWASQVLYKKGFTRSQSAGTSVVAG